MCAFQCCFCVWLWPVSILPAHLSPSQAVEQYVCLSCPYYMRQEFTCQKSSSVTWKGQGCVAYSMTQCDILLDRVYVCMWWNKNICPLCYPCHQPLEAKCTSCVPLPPLWGPLKASVVIFLYSIGPVMNRLEMGGWEKHSFIIISLKKEKYRRSITMLAASANSDPGIEVRCHAETRIVSVLWLNSHKQRKKLT